MKNLILLFLLLVNIFTVKGQGRVPAITNGSSINIAQAPYQVSLQWKSDSSHFCGGSIINNRYVLTAAHCVTRIINGIHTRNIIDKSTITVNVGFTLQDNPGVHHNRFNVSSIVIHPNYSPYPNLDYDIAVIEINGVFTFNDHMQPVQLISQRTLSSERVGRIVRASGWGRTSSLPPTSNRLLAVDVPIITLNTREIVTNYTGTNRQGVCFGDSGGPLVFRQNGQPDIQVGVTSWTNSGCTGNSGYARISSLLDWIRYESEPHLTSLDRLCGSTPATVTLAHRPAGVSVAWTHSPNVRIVLNRDSTVVTIRRKTETSSGKGNVTLRISKNGRVLRTLSEHFTIVPDPASLPSLTDIDGLYPGSSETITLANPPACAAVQSWSSSANVLIISSSSTQVTIQASRLQSQGIGSVTARLSNGEAYTRRFTVYPPPLLSSIDKLCSNTTATIKLSNLPKGAVTAWTTSSNIRMVSSTSTKIKVKGERDISTIGAAWVKATLSSGQVLRESFTLLGAVPNQEIELYQVAVHPNESESGYAGYSQYPRTYSLWLQASLPLSTIRAFEITEFAWYFPSNNPLSVNLNAGVTYSHHPVRNKCAHIPLTAAEITVEIRAISSICPLTAAFPKRATFTFPNYERGFPDGSVFDAYPNPASSLLNITPNSEGAAPRPLSAFNASAYPQTAAYELIDAQREVVSRGNIEGLTTINVSRFTTGVYMLRITTAQGVETHRILIQ